MKTNKRGGSKLPIIITAAALIAAAGTFALIYFLNKPKPNDTSKETTASTVQTSASGSDVSAVSSQASESESKAQEPAKAYTVTVVGKDGASKDYTGRTDADYLRALMDELKAQGDFSYEGNDSDYGLYITAINGVTADYDADGAYWSIYVNGEYGQYGADSQPVNDGDSFKFVYEVYQGQ